MAWGAGVLSNRSRRGLRGVRLSRDERDADRVSKHRERRPCPPGEGVRRLVGPSSPALDPLGVVDRDDEGPSSPPGERGALNSGPPRLPDGRS